MRRLLLALFAALWSTTAFAQQPLCTSLEDCLHLVRNPAQRTTTLDSQLYQRLPAFGAAGVDALVPLLSHPEEAVRQRAAHLLGAFPAIDPAHLPAFLAARRAGNDRLDPAIAATGTEEALAFLWEEFVGGPDRPTYALARFGDRLRPRVTAQLLACRDGAELARCTSMIELLRESPEIPAWATEPLAAIEASANAPQALRRSAEYYLVKAHHPAGLRAVIRHLEQARQTASDRSEFDIRDIGDFGDAGRAAAPLLFWFLAQDSLPESRAAAALALGRIGEQPAIPALIALEPTFTDDWLLAYNAVESLGRLRAEQAKPLLDRVARSHWHEAVRNNAERALNAVDGQPFARSSPANDGAPFVDQSTLYFGDLRFRGDDAVDAFCRSGYGHTALLAQNPLATLRRPRGGTTTFWEADAREFDAPALRRLYPAIHEHAIFTTIIPLADGTRLAGLYSEYGRGGLFHLAADGAARRLFDEPILFAFRLHGRLYVGFGQTHAMISEGGLIVLDESTLRPIRRIRMPAQPYRASVTDAGAIIIDSAEASVALLPDGRLVDPSPIANCPAR